MSPLNLTTALLGLSLAGTILWLLRRDHLHLSHGVFWLAVAAGAATLGLRPGLIDTLAARLGIAYPPAFLFLGAAVLLILKALLSDLQATRIERDLRRLNQRLALLELDLRDAGRTPPDESPEATP